jgi:hypothetical protein
MTSHHQNTDIGAHTRGDAAVFQSEKKDDEQSELELLKFAMKRAADCDDLELAMHLKEQVRAKETVRGQEVELESPRSAMEETVGHDDDVARAVKLKETISALEQTINVASTPHDSACPDPKWRTAGESTESAGAEADVSRVRVDADATFDRRPAEAVRRTMFIISAKDATPKNVGATNKKSKNYYLFCFF